MKNLLSKGVRLYIKQTENDSSEYKHTSNNGCVIIPHFFYLFVFSHVYTKKICIEIPGFCFFNMNGHKMNIINEIL